MAKATVAVTRGPKKHLNSQEVEDLVRTAIELLGGMDKVVRPGDRVLIKPNLVRPAPPPTTTDPRVTAAICKMALEAGAKEVIVGEDTATMTHWWREGMNTRQVFELTGMRKAVEAVGAKILPFDEDEWVQVDIPGALTLRKAGIAKACLEADVIITNPIMKGSMEATASLNIKNLHGVTEPYRTRLVYHRQDIHQKLVDVYRLLRDRIKLGVIDAINPMEGHGPIYGQKVRDFNTIIASHDIVAADCVGVAVMGWDPYTHDMVRLAHHQKLGVGKLEEIDVVGVPLSEFTYRFKTSYPHVKGVFDNIDVIEGGTCRSCQAWIMFALLGLKGAYPDLEEQIARRIGKLTFLSGIQPPTPEDCSDFEGKVVVFGDCALFTAKDVKRQLEDNALYISGCPPYEIGNVIRQIKQFVGLEVTGKEAYEGYGLGAKSEVEEVKA
jgi:uncharacterized protein (DUF362 family)